MFNLDHQRDPNGLNVMSHTLTQHTHATSSIQSARVVARHIKQHRIDIELAGLVTNTGKPVLIKGVRVGVDYAGDGWGDSALPMVGQMVDISFTQGLSTSPHHVQVVKRHYTTQFKPPYHPIQENDDGGYYRQLPHGSYEYQHPTDGTIQYNPKPLQVDGDGIKERSTGVAKSAPEARMEMAHVSTKKAANLTQKGIVLGQRVATVTKQISSLTKLIGRLTQ